MAVDGLGNLYLIWENEDTSGSKNIYFGKMPSGSQSFQTGVIPVDNILGVSDQAQPAIDASESAAGF